MEKLNQESVSLLEMVHKPLIENSVRLHRRQSKRVTPFNLLILIDLAFLALLFSFLFTKLVTLPGMNIGLVETDSKIIMPNKEVVVLTLENQETIFFDGGIYNLNTIELALNRFLETRKGNQSSFSPVSLIIRSDSNLPLESFLKLCSMAENSGYERIQILGREPSNLN